MRCRLTFPWFASLLAAAGVLLPSVSAAGPAEPAPRPATTMPFVGGAGGAYFLAEPGELVVEVEKRDLHRRDLHTELRALLVAPDRQVLEEAVIPDSGGQRGRGPGPVQRVRLATRVPRAGIYALNVTISNDRYGEEVVWRLRTGCARYVVETARGHRDARHEEPIVFAEADRAADLCFLPRAGAFRVELARLSGAAGAPQVYDATGRLLATLAPDAVGTAAHAFPAAAARGATPWRLHLPAAAATVQIDGVTRWEDGDAHPDAALWAPDPAAWFPLPEHRWLVTPYRRNAYGAPGARLELPFQVRNTSARPRTYRLTLEHPDAAWPVTLADAEVRIGPRRSATVVLRATAPATGETRTVHLRVTPSDDAGVSTYATLRVTGGEAPAARALPMPLVLRPYAHENEQFGHWADFPVDNQLYFDGRNRPFVRTERGVARLEDGRWLETPLGAAGAPASTKVAFDAANRVYALARDGGTAVLHVSSDGGRTFSAVRLPAGSRPARSFDLEEFTGHNVPAGPPAILRYTLTAKDEKLFWRSLNDLELFLPRFEGAALRPGDPILLTRECIGLATHSGPPSSVASRGDRVHVVWGEATDPAVKAPGVPAAAATYDRGTGRLSPRAVVGHGPPANDIHNSPSLALDSAGRLHVLGGTHGRPFPYAHSLAPHDAGAGWTPPAVTGEGINQTYIGMVCGPDDTLHAVFRLWRTRTAPHPAATHATLAYQRKRPGQPWETPRVLVVSPFSEYSVFYHRLSIDRRGRLFVSYDYWSTHWFYRNDQPGRRRTVLFSPDGGENWKLATTADLQ
jgi:hypothetical protein